MAVGKNYTVEDSAAPDAPTRSSVAEAEPSVLPFAAVDLPSASAAFAAAAAVRAVAACVADAVAVAVAVASEFAASFLLHPGVPRGWGPSGCMSPLNLVCLGSAYYLMSSATLTSEHCKVAGKVDQAETCTPSAEVALMASWRDSGYSDRFGCSSVTSCLLPLIRLAETACLRMMTGMSGSLETEKSASFLMVDWFLEHCYHRDLVCQPIGFEDSVDETAVEDGDEPSDSVAAFGSSVYSALHVVACILRCPADELVA